MWASLSDLLLFLHAVFLEFCISTFLDESLRFSRKPGSFF